MLKILSSTQTRQLDEATIKTEPIASIDLMERASLAFTQWFVRKFSSNQKVGIVCGTGNNGGDGLAIARLLKERRYDVSVWIVKGGVPETNDFKHNLIRLAGITPVYVTTRPDENAFSNANILIDGLFGSGLSRPLEGIYAEVVSAINSANAIRVAIDIPSGLMADQHSSGSIVKADFTLSFQLPKLAFMLPENGAFVRQWELVDIGLSQDHIAKSETQHLFITERWAREQIIPRKKFSHKGDFGKTLIIAGSHGKMGAAVLASRAALRAGAGLVTVHVPACGYDIIQTSVPEAMASVDAHDTHVTAVNNLDSFDCIGIGPGLGTEKQTAKVIEQVLRSGKPVVIDADGLNLLSSNNRLIKLLHDKVILTPHPGEFRRLAGDWTDDFARLALQRKLSKETGAVVVLKGAHSSIATPDGRIFFNSTGNPGMATGGSGDVLTGILTGLLAQGFDTKMVAVLGVYLHGKAGDLALTQVGANSLLASDIIEMIPAGFKALSH